MGAPQRIQRKRTKGWRMPEGAVYVGRPTKWGNPFTVGGNPSRFSTALPQTCETVEAAVECYRYFASQWMRITRGEWIHGLRGKHLACWCPLYDTEGNRVPCHADVLLQVANGWDDEQASRLLSPRGEAVS